MGLGDILGSISPAYGLISGKGLGGLARYLSPVFDITQLLGHHGGQQAAPTDPTQPMVPMATQSQQSPGLAQLLAALGIG